MVFLIFNLRCAIRYTAFRRNDDVYVYGLEYAAERGEISRYNLWWLAKMKRESSDDFTAIGRTIMLKVA